MGVIGTISELGMLIVLLLPLVMASVLLSRPE